MKRLYVRYLTGMAAGKPMRVKLLVAEGSMAATATPAQIGLTMGIKNLKEIGTEDWTRDRRESA